MTRKRAKKLPHGNLKAVGNLSRSGGLHGVMGTPKKAVLVFGGGRFPGYHMPVGVQVKPPHEYHPPPGGENAGLPENGPPGSEWWNQPPYNGRR